MNFKHVPDESSDDKEYGTPLKLRRNIRIGEDETLDDCVTPPKVEIVTETTNGTLSSEGKNVVFRLFLKLVDTNDMI